MPAITTAPPAPQSRPRPAQPHPRRVRSRLHPQPRPPVPARRPGRRTLPRGRRGNRQHRRDRPKLRAILSQLQPGDTLVIHKPARVARSMKKLPVFVEDELHARGITLKILTAACGGVHRPDGAGLADRLLFAVAALAAVMERELIRERTLDRPRAGPPGRGRRASRRQAEGARWAPARASSSSRPPQSKNHQNF